MMKFNYITSVPFISSSYLIYTMPPKQKEQKKGPVYKNSVLPKDIVPTQIKQNPRQIRPIKSPETFAEPAKMNKLQNPFDAWPSEQIIKAHDFGIMTEKKFEDPFHDELSNFIKIQNLIQWKSFHQIQKLKQTKKKQQQDQLSDQEDHKTKSHSNFQPLIDHQANEKKQLVVIQTFLRDENQEQTQARLAQQAEKAEKAAKDKKKGKKQEIKQQGPIKVSDVQMKDIIVNKHMCEEGIWIGSQLQIIKLRNITDVYTKQPVWKKIYPQQNGVPKLTKSGKYWVKLYYMGKTIKIQVDDRIPINVNINQMFPLSQKQHEKWTLILTKALIKLLAKTKSECKVVGNNLIFYALTGMICETVSLQNFKQWEILNSYLSDQHYLDKDIFLSCYANCKKKSPSNFLRNPSQVKDFLLLQNSNFKNIRPRKNSANQLNIGIRESIQFEKEEYVQNEVIGGYAYCIGDYFQNGQFNMAFSKQRSQKQTKLRHQYLQLSKVSLSTKTRQQKLEHRKKKKQIKQLLSLEEKKRSDMINKDTSSYHFIKILSDIKIHCQFTQRQILLAKKCVANKLNQPPNYQMPGQKQENKSMKSVSLIKTTKEQFQINPDITDFSVLDNPVDLLSKNDKGIWIKSVDFISTFSEIQIIYNPVAKVFEYKKIQTIESQGQNQYTTSQNREILVIQKVKQDDKSIQNIDLLFGFSYQQIRQNKQFNPYCMLQKFDFNQFAVTSTLVKLSKIMDSKLLHLKNQNNVFRLYTMCKGNFNYQISCQSPFKLMSIGQYLQQYQGYKKQLFSIQYPALESKNYFCLTKLKIKEQSQSKSSLVIKLNTSIKSLSKGLSYKLVKIPQQSKSYTNEYQQGIIQKNNQFKFLAEQYTKIKIQPNQLYYLIVECSPIQNIQEGTCDLIVYSQNQTLEVINQDQVEPTKYIQKYIPNKYGLIFRERIFSNLESSQSFYVKLIQGQELQATGSIDKKNQKKGGKDQVSAEIIQKPLTEKKKINLIIMKNEVTLYETKGFNQLVISNVNLPNIKSQQHSQYLIQARFDLQEWPQAKKQSEQTSKIYWSMIVFGTDSIALVRDTKQQQKQKQTRKSWQDKEPGRAERAKKARRKFLIELKKQKGQQLNQQQISIISMPRLTKKQQIQEDKKNQQKNKKGAKKQDKKAGKQIKKQEVQQKQNQRQFPKSGQNYMCEIKQFLQTLQNYQVHYIKKDDNFEAKIRSQEQLNSIKESSEMSRQNRIGKLIRNIQKRQTINIKEKQKKDQLSIYLQETMSQFKQLWSKYNEWRNQDLEKDKTRQQKERSIIDIINQEKIMLTEADLNKIITEYRQVAGFNQNIANIAIMIKKNLKINALSQKISGHLTAWEVQQLKLIKQQIQKQKIQIEETLLKNIDQIIEQANKNPALITQKQNEAKKAKKGGKK